MNIMKLQMKKKKRWVKNIILITDLLQVKDILNSKEEDEEKSKSQPKEAIPVRGK